MSLTPVVCDCLQQLIDMFPWCRKCGKSVPDKDYLCTTGCCVYPYEFNLTEIEERITTPCDKHEWPSRKVCVDMGRMMKDPCCNCQYGWSDIVSTHNYVEHMLSIVYLSIVHRTRIEKLQELVKTIGKVNYDNFIEYRRKVFISGLLKPRQDVVKLHTHSSGKKFITSCGSYFTKECLHSDLTTKYTDLNNYMCALNFDMKGIDKPYSYRPTWLKQYGFITNIKNQIMSGKIEKQQGIELLKEEIIKIKPTIDDLNEQIEGFKLTGIEGIDYEWKFIEGSHNLSFVTDYGYYDDKHETKFTDENKYSIDKYDCSLIWEARNFDNNYMVYREPEFCYQSTTPIISVDGFIANKIHYEIDTTNPPLTEYQDRKNEYPNVSTRPDFNEVTGYFYNLEHKRYEKH